MMLAPGAPDFLDFLQERKVPFTIATASDKENVDFYFEHLGIGKWFDYDRIVYNNGQIKGKPDPQIYRIAMVGDWKTTGRSNCFLKMLLPDLQRQECGCRMHYCRQLK